MRQIASRLRFLRLAGSLPFHKAHSDRLGEEKAKSNLENFRVAFQAGSTSAIATCEDLHLIALGSGRARRIATKLSEKVLGVLHVVGLHDASITEAMKLMQCKAHFSTSGRNAEEVSSVGPG